MQLAQLAADSDAILRPLAREREHVAGFFSNSGAAAQASAEKGEQLQESFRKFPEFLREFRATMVSLKAFSDAGTPVFSDFDRATPAFTEATRLLAPFSRASTVALKSLGDAGEVAGPKFRAADPIVKKARDLARSGVSPTNQLAKFLVSTKKTGGWNGLVDLIYNTTATINGFDQYGHFARGAVRLTNCLDYEPIPAGTSGCVARFNGPAAQIASSSISSAELYELLREELERPVRRHRLRPLRRSLLSPPPSSAPAPDLGQGQQIGGGRTRVAPPPARPQRALLDYLLGP